MIALINNAATRPSASNNIGALAKLAKRLKEKNLKLDVTDEAKEFIIEKGSSVEYGEIERVTVKVPRVACRLVTLSAEPLNISRGAIAVSCRNPSIEQRLE